MTSGQAARVLVADDDPMARELAGLVVTAAGGSVVAALGDGTEVLAWVHDVDVLLLDVHMPGPPLADLVSSVRTANPAAFVVVVTAAADDERQGLRSTLDVDDVVGKGDADALTAAIRSVRRGARG